MRAPRVLREWQKPAKSEVVCDCCGGIIEKGESYIRQDMMDPDTKEKWIWRSHVACESLTQFLPKKYHEQGFTGEEFVKFTMDHARSRHCNGCPFYYKEAACKAKRSAQYCASYVESWIREGIRRKNESPKVSNDLKDIGGMMK